MNKKLYWGTVSLIAFLAITAIGAGYSLISFPDGSDLGISKNQLNKSGFTNLTNAGYVFTNLFGFGGLAILSFSFKRFKTFTLSSYMYSVLLFVINISALILGITHYLSFIFLVSSIIILVLSWRIQKQLQALGQW